MSEPIVTTLYEQLRQVPDPRSARGVTLHRIMGQASSPTLGHSSSPTVGQRLRPHWASIFTHGGPGVFGHTGPV